MEKLDQIYALCYNCQRKLNQHIANLDRLVGEHNDQVLSKTKQQKVIKNNKANLLKPLGNITNSIEPSANNNNNNNNNTNNKLSSITTRVKTIKAHTIAGTVPPYTFVDKNNKDNNKVMNKDAATAAAAVVVGGGGKNRKESITNANARSQREHIATSKTIYRLVFGDMFISLCIIATFIADLAHLFHDSEYIKLHRTNKLLFIYDHLSYLLSSCAIVSLGVVLYRLVDF